MGSMKRWLPWVVAVVAIGWSLSHLRPARDTGIAVSEFGRLPVVFNGRLQPFDSVARNSLLQIRGKQTLREEGKPGTTTAMEWLLELMAAPEKANARKVFRIDHPDLKALFGLPLEANEAAGDDGKHYSLDQLSLKFDRLREQSTVARSKEAVLRTPFEQAVLKLGDAVTLYLRLQNTLKPVNSQDFEADLVRYREVIPSGTAAFRDRMAGRPFDTNALTGALNFAQQYLAMHGMEPPLVVSPHHPERERDNWMRTGEALLESSFPVALLRHLINEERIAEDEVDRLVAQAGTVPLHPSLPLFGKLTTAYAKVDVATFNSTLTAYRGTLTGTYHRELSKASQEQVFNRAQPFYTAMVLYIAAFLLACGFWFASSEPLRRTAWWLVMTAFVVHTAGLIARMWLEGRPPVTNLYSSAVFIGWGAVGLGLILERIWRNAIGLAVAGILSFASLIVAHHLAQSGDTMEMMRAVLDTNFWLATHVVIVTLGYAATYVAGFLSILYVLVGFSRRTMTPEFGRSLTRAVYGIICFATLFSFTGTVLGGIWADQSWGRFWGWDPKENGALIIVLWNALILHARWGGLAKERGIHLLSIAGNIVTSWSWFGTNMLGVGLHAYGFMDAAFKALMAFVVFNLVIIGLGYLPRPTGGKLASG
jgi:ABC-type transport system involved in cytochrome c biogenesis permease subunit